MARRVMALGVGMAGLGAATRLARGADATVIEARDRSAGRTQASRLWPDLPVDMGVGAPSTGWAWVL
jgi:uncharacterized protein with NAD-binding domain and iron-sulfur cluster